jgi:hypothetical protein
MSFEELISAVASPATASSSPWTAALTLGAQVASQVGQSQAAARQARYGAQMAEHQAALGRQYAALDEQARRDRTRAIAARQAARLGKAGIVVEGTPLDVTLDTGASGELEALGARHGGALDAYRLSHQAAMGRERARSAATTGYLGAGAHILGRGPLLFGD